MCSAIVNFTQQFSKMNVPYETRTAGTRIAVLRFLAHTYKFRRFPSTNLVDRWVVHVHQVLLSSSQATCTVCRRADEARGGEAVALRHTQLAGGRMGAGVRILCRSATGTWVGGWVLSIFPDAKW